MGVTLTAGERDSQEVEQCECPWGYAGTSCESCLPGFYRVDGVMFGGNCLPCECNDHASECDISGVCVGCAHNTTGPHCDQCLPGFYGDASEGTPDDCQRCACPHALLPNNFSPTCTLLSSGDHACDQCAVGHEGRLCERCADGYYGDPMVAGQRCRACECSGNVDPSEAGQCDRVTGACLKCAHHTAGRHCQRCQDGFYGDAVTQKNCTACDCHGDGAVSSVCDVVTGQCQCKAAVVGRACEHCQEGYYGLESGCRPCECNHNGSVSGSCDEEGRCQCVTGVTGAKCDQCLSGFYSFSENGCTPCDCSHTQGNCDSETGECTCPEHTRGLECEECEEGHWGHGGLSGCKVCNCSVLGSLGSQCHLLSGQCPCGSAFSGLRCDRCALGYRNYPECTACNCNPSGTRAEQCDRTLGVCGCEEGGSCACKENVGGGGCDECKSGWFGLSPQNPSGCSACFCSGVSSECEERGGLVRVPVTLGSDPALLRVATLSDLRGAAEGVWQEEGQMVVDVLEAWLQAGPLYWRLPQQFCGEQLLAYGGTLSYTVQFFAEDGRGLTNQEPQVVIKGGALQKLVLYTDVPAPGNAVSATQEVPLTEHTWRYFNSVWDTPVSRGDFMAVLSEVEYVLVKASFGAGLRQSRIWNVSMETAVEAAVVGGAVARLVEECVCPSGYAGLSCQECAPGFYRQPTSPLSARGRSQPPQLPCVPCQCHNHSTSCDLHTGECVDCQHNTSGRHCGVCASGFYGTVRGSAADCSLCACPLRGQSFSSSCVSEGASDFRCDRCETGYEGRYCERCSLGYYGSPSEAGGRCQQCRCGGAGAADGACDGLTGSCRCKAGFRGHLCQSCEERHVLHGEQCVSCEDGCSSRLLDELDALGHSLGTLDLSGAVLAPYRSLMELENRSRAVQGLMALDEGVADRLRMAEGHLTDLSDDVTGLQQQVEEMRAQADDVTLRSAEQVSSGKQLLVIMSDLFSSVLGVREQVAALNVTPREPPREENATVLLRHMTSDLQRLRLMRVSGGGDAEAELSSALGVMRWLEQDVLTPDTLTRTQLLNISSRLDALHLKLQEAQESLNTSQRFRSRTHQLIQEMQRNLQQLRSSGAGLVVLRRDCESVLAEVEEVLAAAVELSEDLRNVTATQDDLLSALDRVAPPLRTLVDSLVLDLSRRDALRLVYRAEDHAHTLGRQARELERSLRNTSSPALNISSSLSSVWAAVRLAEELAHQAARSWRPDHALSQRSAARLRSSGEALQEGVSLAGRSRELQRNVSGASVRVASVRAQVQNFTRRLPDALSGLRSLGGAGGAEEAGRRAEAVEASLREALRRVDVYRLKLQGVSSTLSSTSASAGSSTRLLDHSHQAAAEAQARLQEVEVKAEQMFQGLKPLQTLGENLSRNLSDIRELIRQARQQAASIKVAVAADRNCVRSYRSEVTSSNINTLTLTLKTAHPDNLLFYLGSSHREDFLAVEMRDGRVNFLWDTGSGATRLEFPALQINNSRWHRINATRFGRHGSLTVYPADSEAPPPVRASAPGSSSVLDLDSSSRVFVGGLGTWPARSPALTVSDFRGCVGGASLNEKSIGLWNYAEREGPCGGCFMSPPAGDTSFHFDGSGYSVMVKPLRAMSTSVVLFFRTLSPSGLLLYLPSNATRDFLSVELVEGKVHLTFDLGSGALTLTSGKSYNTGWWYRLALQRNRRRGHVSVMAAENPTEREVMEGESPGAASDLNRSDLDPIYIGGLPSSRPIRKPVARSFVGCLRNVEVSRSNLDLLRESSGVKKGCELKPIRSASLFGSGYLEMPGVMLTPHTEVMTSFSSRREGGVVLAGLGVSGEVLLSVTLVPGAMEVRVGGAEGGAVNTTTIRSANGSFGDGREHSLILQRNKRSVLVLVDEQDPVALVGEAGERVLALARLFVGGVPPGVAGRGFYGCIRNAAVDGVLLDLSAALRYQGVDVNSCLLEERPTRPILPGEQEVEPTPDPAPLETLAMSTDVPSRCSGGDHAHTLPHSQQFGSSRHSHVTLGFRNKTIRSSVVVKLALRTFASSGLLFYMANANQQDFCALQLLSGRLLFTCDLGRGPAHATLPTPLHPGHWHSVKAEFSKKTLRVGVDGTVSDPAPIKGHTLDVEGKLYVGGVPASYAARRLGNVTHSLAGCVQDVRVNDAPLNLSAPLSAHDTHSCFTTAQDATYFSGEGYAAFMREGYSVGSELTVRLEFRSGVAGGVLMGVSSTKVDAVGLELVSGGVAFHVNNGAGRVTVRSGGATPVCDGRWHTLVARKQKHSLSLTLDGHTVSALNPYASSTSAETKNPVYVGGFPAEVKQNALSARESFRGCMRNLRLQKTHATHTLEFSSAFTRLHVHPHSCPAP